MQRIIPQRVETRAPLVTGAAHMIFLYVGIGLFILVISSFAALFFLNKKGSEIEQGLASEIQQKGEELRSGVGKEAAILERRLKKIQNLLEAHNFSSSVIKFIEAQAHPQVRFMSFNFSESNQKVELAAETQGFGIVAQQIGFLKNDPNVSKVEFGGLSLGERGKVNFSITILLKTGFTKTKYKSQFDGVEEVSSEPKIPVPVKSPVETKTPAPVQTPVPVKSPVGSKTPVPVKPPVSPKVP